MSVSPWEVEHYKKHYKEEWDKVTEAVDFLTDEQTIKLIVLLMEYYGRGILRQRQHGDT